MTTITLLTIAQLRTLNTHSAAAAPPPPQEAPSAAFIIAAWLLELAKKWLSEEEQTASTAKIMLTRGLNVAERLRG